MEKLFNSEVSADNIKNQIRAKTKFKYLFTQTSTLGGLDNICIIIHTSREAKEHWENDIYHNSNYAIFCLSNYGELEQYSRQALMPKFRKSRAKNIDDVIKKLNEYNKKELQYGLAKSI